MTISGPKLHCQKCSKTMIRWGRTITGKTRWRCSDCSSSNIRKRKDNREKSRLSLYVRWLTSKASLSDIARLQRVSVRTLLRWFELFWDTPPKPIVKPGVRVLVVDATSVVKRKLILSIAACADTGKPVFWRSAPHECYDVWVAFFRHLLLMYVIPKYIVCDGQKGLLKAIREVYPEAMIQRCMIHVIRWTSGRLTQNPKTRAGRELLLLVKQLSSIQTKRQKRRWIRAFRYWHRRHHDFLKERSHGPNGRWWYTHRRLRSVRSHINNVIPDLFRYVSDPSIPKTSNLVEGGLNARIKELFRCHRGLSPLRKLALASWYLALRQGQKPTRSVH